MSKHRFSSEAHVRSLAAGELEGGELEVGELEVGELEVGKIELGEFRAGELQSGELGAGELDAGELDAGELDASELDASELDAAELGAGELEAGDPLSAEDRQLLASARAALQGGSVPGPVRQRLFERVLDEARRPASSPVLSASPLVPVRPRGVWMAVGSAAAMAFGLVLLASVPSLFRGSGDSFDEGLAAETTPRPEQRLGDRVFQSALFRAPAPAWSGALPPASESLFGESPFSTGSRAWQVKRWDDLGRAPAEPAKYHFEQGALCVSLYAGERVLGGWPWVAGAARPIGGAVPGPLPAGGAAPAPVALTAGKAYRLVFRAWASEPLPAQLLIAVGHAELPFSAAGGARVDVSTTPSPFVVSFVAKHDDPSVGVAFLANASAEAAPTRVCLSDVTLTERAPRPQVP